MGHDDFFQRLTGELGALFRRDIARLTQEIHAFPDEASLWHVVPGVNNCAGNLILHLEGNLREYVGRRLGGVPYQRNRAAEFSERGLTRSDLVNRIESLGFVPEILKRMSEEQWFSECGDDPLPGARSTGQFLTSLYGHFHYHLGQIDYLRRILTKGTAVSFAQLESPS